MATNEINSQGIRDSIAAYILGVRDAFKSIINLDLKVASAQGVRHTQHLTTRYKTIASVPFSGAITGEFFICVDLMSFSDILIEMSALPSDSPELLDLLRSTLKEISNTAAGETIAAIKNTFGPVTMLSPRLIEGKIYYPATQIFGFGLEDNAGNLLVEARISFDMMEQEITVEHEKLKADSKLDDTGLYNKRYFSEFLQEKEEFYKDSGTFTIVFVDLNRLKFVNDTYGHEAGDAYIKAACDLIRQSCRTSDYCFRVGGDEIVIFVPNTGLNESMPIIRRIERFLSTAHITAKDAKGEEVKVPINLSVGIASKSEGIPAAEVYSTADQRMEEAKREWYKSANIKRRK